MNKTPRYCNSFEEPDVVIYCWGPHPPVCAGIQHHDRNYVQEMGNFTFGHLGPLHPDTCLISKLFRSISLSVCLLFLQSEGQSEGEGLLVSPEFGIQREKFSSARWVLEPKAFMFCNDAAVEQFRQSDYCSTCFLWCGRWKANRIRSQVWSSQKGFSVEYWSVLEQDT